MNTETRSKINEEAASHYELYLTTARLSTPASLGKRNNRGSKDKSGKKFVSEEEAYLIVSEVLAAWMEVSNEKVQAIIDKKNADGSKAGSIKNYINKSVVTMTNSWKSSHNYVNKKQAATVSYDAIVSDHDGDCDESRASWYTEDAQRDYEACTDLEYEEYEEDSLKDRMISLKDYAVNNLLTDTDAEYFRMSMAVANPDKSNRGYMLQQIADEFGVSISTIRVSLKRSISIIAEYCNNNI